MQHVLSRWLLGAFAKGGDLATYDHQDGTYDSASPEKFLAEVDGHSAAIEVGIRDIESPASAAAWHLQKRVKNLGPGLYPLTAGLDAPSTSGPRMRDGGRYQGTSIVVAGHELPMPPDKERRALLRYAGLMYQRSPATEATMLRHGDIYNRAAEAALADAAPGLRSGLPKTLDEELARRRARMLEMAASLEAMLERANWFVLRPPPGCELVLGDCAVMATPSLGVDAGWIPLLAPASFAVVMPISPLVALLLAPQAVLPMNLDEVTPTSMANAVNRLSWRHADRYVVARRRSHIEASMPSDAKAIGSARASVDVEQVADAARRDVQEILGEVRRELLHRRYVDEYLRVEGRNWHDWDGCRLRLGEPLYAPEDRDLVRDPCPAWPARSGLGSPAAAPRGIPRR